MRELLWFISGAASTVAIVVIAHLVRSIRRDIVKHDRRRSDRGDPPFKPGQTLT